MNRLSLLVAGLMLNSMLMAQNFYQLPLNSIDGTSINLSKLAGKKILFLIVPANETDSLLPKIDTFLASYGNKIRILGIVSTESGAVSIGLTAIKSLYAVRNVLLTECIFTQKVQVGIGPLLQWLTNKEKNLHFNFDATGVGHKFFVSETGILYAV